MASANRQLIVHGVQMRTHSRVRGIQQQIWKIFWSPAEARRNSASVAVRFSRMTFVHYAVSGRRLKITEEAAINP
jgi:hypothetical protein